MSTPDGLEREFTLLTAVARYNELRMRDALSAPADEHDVSGRGQGDPHTVALSRDEALELLALGELVARKASYGRQLGVRTARAAGASWSQIGAALGTTKQAAWEAHDRWINEQADQRRRDES
jgi:hypothetical protein